MPNPEQRKQNKNTDSKIITCKKKKKEFFQKLCQILLNHRLCCWRDRFSRIRTWVHSIPREICVEVHGQDFNMWGYNVYFADMHSKVNFSGVLKFICFVLWSFLALLLRHKAWRSIKRTVNSASSLAPWELRLWDGSTTSPSLRSQSAELSLIYPSYKALGA